MLEVGPSRLDAREVEGDVSTQGGQVFEGDDVDPT